jgi:hypothetical protein
MGQRELLRQRDYLRVRPLMRLDLDSRLVEVGVSWGGARLGLE